jgi:hypothetical protein
VSKDSGVLRRIGELAIVGAKVRTHGEMGPAAPHDFFWRIGVLDDEVAGVARHHHGLHRTPPMPIPIISVTSTK